MYNSNLIFIIYHNCPIRGTKPFHYIPSAQAAFLSLLRNGVSWLTFHGELGRGGTARVTSPDGSSPLVWRGRVRPAIRDFRMPRSGYRFDIPLQVNGGDIPTDAFTVWQTHKSPVIHVALIVKCDYQKEWQTYLNWVSTQQISQVLGFFYRFVQQQIFKLEYWQSQEGPRRALCKFAGAMLQFLKSRSKVTVKVTCSKFMVPLERPCHKVHTCQIWKLLLRG